MWPNVCYSDADFSLIAGPLLRCSLLSFPFQDHQKDESDNSWSQSQDDVAPSPDCQTNFSTSATLPTLECDPTTGHQSLQTLSKDLNLQNPIQLLHPNLVVQISHKCLRCHQTFPSKYKLESHISIKHKLEKKLKPKPTSRNKCSFCPLKFSKKSQYFLHANAAHKSRIATASWKLCNFCTNYFPSQELLRHHKCSQLGTSDDNSKLVTTENIVKTNNGTGETERPIFYETLHHSIKIEEEIVVPKSKKVPTGKSCLFCLKELTKTRGLLRHYNSIHKDRVKDCWPECSHCQIYFPTEDALERHKKTAHENIGQNYKGIFNQGRVSCDFCAITLIRPGEYYKHANKIHLQEIRGIWTRCKGTCKKYFPNAHSLSKHNCFKYAQEKVTNPYHFCPLCPQKFSAKKLYVEHANRVHVEAIQELGWLFCSACCIYLPEVDTLNRHTCSNFATKAIDEHATLKAKSSNKTDKGRNPNSLLKPRESESKPDIKNEFHSNVACQLCVETFKNLSEYEQHLPACQATADSFCGITEAPDWIKTEYQEDEANLVDPLAISVPPIKLDYQYQNVHTFVNIAPNKIQILDYVPIQVTKTVSERVVSKPSSGVRTCQFCQKMLSTPRCYLRHVNTFHIDLIQDSWHYCPQCKTYFQTDTALQTHNTSAHAIIGEKYSGIFYTKKSACQFCPKSFVRASEYYKHANNVHGKTIGSTWKKCLSICQKHFPSQEVLDRHNCSTYATSKVTTCDICSQTVAASTIYDHANKYHKDCIAQKWLKCDVCSKHFPNVQVLAKHMAKSHRATPLLAKIK